MKQPIKYSVILFVLALFTFVSCKSKKIAASRENAVSKVDENSTKNDVEFAYLYVTGCSERIKGNLQESLKLFEQCKKINASDPAVRYELATIYKLLGVNDQAISNAKFSADADPRNEYYQLLLIDSYNADKQYTQAVKIRESLVKNFPAKNEFKEDLAIQYAIMGLYDKSFKIYEELERSVGINEQISLNKVKLLKSQRKFIGAEFF